MNTQKTDWFKWIVVVVLLIAGVVANSYFSSVAVGLRAAGWIVLLVIALAIAYFTHQGKLVWGFAKGARGEWAKVVKPTSQETVQTAAMVIVVVLITALILWGFDSLFMWAIGLLTGQ
ncbi:MAG: preprotein translocase subunit SecE [Gammaproteobacteria bacterium]|nr:preprotein translocase subunit SecE [Gammaproteobacteria bacterium]